MWIHFSEVCEIAKRYGKEIRGVLHLGAHDCEEQEAYVGKGIDPKKIYWIEAISEKVKMNQQKGIPNVYEAVIYNEERLLNFYVSRDVLSQGSVQSSSVLPFQRHLAWYPHIGVDHVEQKQSIRLDTWIEKNNVPIDDLNFWNLDIQGVEYHALQSAGKYLDKADVLYVEVNVEELYKDVPLLPVLDTFLREKGFMRVAIQMAMQGWGDAIYIRGVWL